MWSHHRIILFWYIKTYLTTTQNQNTPFILSLPPSSKLIQWVAIANVSLFLIFLMSVYAVRMCAFVLLHMCELTYTWMYTCMLSAYLFMYVMVWDWWQHPQLLLHTTHWDRVSQSNLIWLACSGDLALLSGAWITSRLTHPLYLLRVLLSSHDHHMQEDVLSSYFLSLVAWVIYDS